MCYTVSMQERSFWFSWAKFLHQKGLAEPAATLLEALNPLRIVLAQFVYAGQPFLPGGKHIAEWDALAGMLENQEESRKFAAFLRKGGLD